MFRIIALTSRRVTNWSSPQAWTSFIRYREWWPWQEWELRSIKLVKPPQSGQVLFGLLLLSCLGWTYFWFCRRGLTCQVSKASVFDNFVLFWPLKNTLKTNVTFCLLMQACAAHAQHSYIRITRGVGMYWRHDVWVSGVALWCEKLGHHFSSRQISKSSFPL